MKEYFLGDIGIKIEKRKIKNIYLRIYENLEVKLVVPRTVSNEIIEGIILKKEDWIRKRLEEMKSRELIRDIRKLEENRLRIFGREYKIVEREIEAYPNYMELEKDSLIVYTKQIKNRKVSLKLIENFLRVSLEEEARKLISKWERRMSIRILDLKIRHMYRSWGSYRRKAKRISLNFKLVHLDIKYLEYVIVHEMLHYFIGGHSKEFKDLMDFYLPNWKDIDKSLKKYRLEK